MLRPSEIRRLKKLSRRPPWMARIVLKDEGVLSPELAERMRELQKEAVSMAIRVGHQPPPRLLGGDE